jgi:hypothetical protein
MPLILTARNTAPGRPQSTAALSIPQRPWNGWSMDHFFGGKNHGKSPWKNHCLLGRRGTCYMWHVQKLPVRCNMRAYPRPCWEPTFFARCGPIQRKPSWDGQTVSREAKSGMGKTAVFVLACLQNLEISKSVGSQVTRRLWIGGWLVKKTGLSWWDDWGWWGPMGMGGGWYTLETVTMNGLKPFPASLRSSLGEDCADPVNRTWLVTLLSDFAQFMASSTTT